MKKRRGQAGREVIEALHRLGCIAMLFIAILLLAFGVLGFRLSQGPIEIPALASWLATEFSGQSVRVQMQSAELAWAGYHEGGGVPLELRLGNVEIRNAGNMRLATVPVARLWVSPSLLFDRRAPIVIAASGAQISGSAAPVSLRAVLRLGRQYRLVRADLDVRLGAGRLGAGGNSLPIKDGAFSAEFAPGHVVLSGGVLHLAPVGASAPTIGFGGAAALAHGWHGGLRITADKVRAADLPAYWPPAALPATRQWVVRNIQSGTAKAADFTLFLSVPGDLGSLTLDNAAGHFDGEALALNWIPGTRPITALNGRFTLLDADTALVTAQSAQLGGLSLSAGTLKIVGLNHKDQTGLLSLAAAGGVQDVIAILAPKPLGLLNAMPPQIARATGTVAASIRAAIPFKLKLNIDEVALKVQAQLRDMQVNIPVAGLGFTALDGMLDATTQGLKLQAAAQLAGEPATLTLTTPFAKAAAGHLLLQGAAGPQLLHWLGVDGQSALAGPVTGTARFVLRMDGPLQGRQTVSLDADLTPAALSLPELGWRKPAGAPARLSLAAGLTANRFDRLDAFSAQGPDLDIAGAQSGSSLVFSQMRVGRTRASGTLTPPGAGQKGWSARFIGAELDLRAASASSGQKNAAPAPGDASSSGPAWQVRLDFTQLDLAAAPAPALRDFQFQGSGAGGTLLQAQASAQGMALAVTPVSAVRHNVQLQVADAGLLLSALGAYDGLEGGAGSLQLQYGGAPASGEARLERFHILNAPKFAKLLQGASIYGVADAAQGPGLFFNRAVIPFQEDAGKLTLLNARAYSASLGFTASGSVALGDGDADLDATIVPAYALNSALGKIPVLGHLFTAEKGGGLLAVRAKITGPLDNPVISINPLSALTPGVLRDLFGLGGSRAKP